MIGSKLLYYLFIKPLSFLPMFVLHGISSFFFVPIYYLFGYRKKVIRGNIERSLTHLTTKQQRKIERKFYQHFCDLIFESIKNFSISSKSVKKRMITLNPELVNKYADQNRNVALVGGHFNNWEISAVGFPFFHKHIGIGVYKPLSNKFFDEKIRKSREKNGLKMISMKESTKLFSQTDDNFAFMLATDQSPSNPKKGYWMDFLGQDTAVLYGTEKYCRDFNIPVLFGDLKKVKRGYYTVEYKELFINSKDTKYGEITEAHTKTLEKQILETPQFWLWSHRRWKHTRPKNHVNGKL